MNPMNDSYWMQTTPDAQCPKLEHSHETEIVVIGGGLTGLHTALRILEEEPGTNLTLIEADRICSDASGRTMGKVTVSHSRIFQHLSNDKAKMYAAANKEGFHRILDIIEAYNIDCDLQRVANYVFTSAESHVSKVRKDFESMRESGLEVEWVEPRNSESQEIALDFLAGLRQAEQAVYHPRKFALGLLQAIKSLGGHVFEHTLATNITEHDEGVTVTLDGGGSLYAKKAIVATRIGLPVDEPFADSLLVWRTHFMAYLFDDIPVRNAYIRYESPVASFRPNNAFLLMSGRDADALPFEDEKHYQAIETWTQEAYAKQMASNSKEETYFWWGEETDSADMLPLIGKYRKDSHHTFVATGYCGWGMTKSAFAGIMLTDLVLGKESSYQKCFDPWRF